MYKKGCSRPGCENGKSWGSLYCSRACEEAHLTRRQRTKSRQRAFVAAKTGRIVKPGRCELCQGADKLVAHHWHGYSDEHATNVWWICQGCNMKLKGEHFHNGSVTLGQAKAIIAERQ